MAHFLPIRVAQVNPIRLAYFTPIALAHIHRYIHVESKAIELLLLQLEQINAIDNSIRYKLNKSDTDKMYAVKEILEQNFQEIGTLIDLSRKVGTNEYMLKKGFKELFGTTVYGYWRELKLLHAHELLLEGKSVEEVTMQLGYSQAHNFTAAFKKRFGVVPSQLE